MYTFEWAFKTFEKAFNRHFQKSVKMEDQKKAAVAVLALLLLEDEES